MKQLMNYRGRIQFRTIVNKAKAAIRCGIWWQFYWFLGNLILSAVDNWTTESATANDNQ